MKVAAIVGLVAACSSGDKPQPAPALVDLSASLDAFRTEFDAHAQEAHFLTLLSPT